MAILAIGDIILSSINDAYTVLLSPNSCVINADFDGSNPELASAYTNITVSKGGKAAPFKLTLDSLSNDKIKYKILDVGGNTQRVVITSLPTDILSGSICLILKTESGDYSTNVAFQFSIVRESTMLDWIQDWESGKTEIGGAYLITPKIFVGSNLKTNGDTSSLTGVYIGPDSSLMGTSSAGLYGYKNGTEIFHINETGGNIGGWSIASDGIQTADGNLKILSEGSVVSYDKGAIVWGLYKSGEASFAKGNVLFHKDGSAYFAGEVRSQSGNIGGWNLQYGSLYSEHVLLDAANDFIGIGQFNISSTAESLGNRIQSVTQNGGVYMYYSSTKSYGIVGNLPIGTDGVARQVFSLGATNKIASWNFDDEAFWIGNKTNAIGGYTPNNQSITIGSCGLRGKSWYIDSNGEVSFANGRVIFDSSKDIYRIADWNIDNDVLYTGTKSLSGFTINEGSISLGASGLRGRWWRLEGDGSGELAGGGVVWDKYGVLKVNGGVVTGQLSSPDGEMVLDLSNKTLTAQGTAVIYATNIQLQSSSTGKFEDVGGALNNLQSSMSGLRQDLTEGVSFLNNSSFNNNLSSWETDSHGALFTFGGKWLWVNGAPYSNKGDFAAVKDDEGRRTVFIKNNYILQRNSDFRHIPIYTETNSDGLRLPEAVYLTFYYNVKKQGRLTINFENSDQSDFVPFDEFEYVGDIEENSGYKIFTCAGLWNGTGDFKLSFTGEINIYMLILSTDKTDTLVYRYSTFFNQSDKLINIAAANFDADGNVLKSSGILTSPDGNQMYAFDADGNLCSLIDQTAGEIKIKASQIKFEGLVTANNNFKILEDGSVEAKSGKFAGIVEALQGRFGALRIVGNDLIGYDASNNESIRLSIGNAPSISAANKTELLEYQITENAPYQIYIDENMDGAYNDAVVEYEAEYVYDRVNDIAVVDNMYFTFDIDFNISKPIDQISFYGQYGAYAITDSGHRPEEIEAFWGLWRLVDDDFVIVTSGNNFSALPDITINEIGQYRLSVVVDAEPHGDDWRGIFRVNTPSIFMEYVGLPNNSTTFAKDGLLSFNSATQYLSYSETEGFVVRCGDYGLRLTDNGLQQLKNGTWITI